VALWSGEEQGDFGSLGYVKSHVATLGRSTTLEQMEVPEFLREAVGPVTAGAEYSKLSSQF
jgi:carboxypeptidase Q